ncbi:hypothetical protein A3J90_01875 [candidate division WOR-1 bacterium RIFOXYC2_FULL_37_10]|uniref:DUF86 domain-containing protein n=1 Tax=candidate division WOR-1 bacterium RIFOXYB2_FULL_37_13 TaxID=1802579 RepID=A0A1F4SUA0_UNCSA|nr:MAG: hypothetical protein A2310_05690 [candidate division WOR-1 bacterium RIFOXYB2_FULL_37_13]OGC33907.1 MAG: hypothetical protein A3J90_01875 [candidate division WOR-1 bacterium RIFOXYC2_FULL_37_10]
MVEFSYAKGRIADSLQFILQEIKEFEVEYNNKSWEQYHKDSKIQKLMEKTVENILTALLEVGGTILAEKGIATENYKEVLMKTAELFNFTKEEQESLSKLAVQRNRLAHRYLDLKWESIKMFKGQVNLIKKLLQKVLELQ